MPNIRLNVFSDSEEISKQLEQIAESLRGDGENDSSYWVKEAAVSLKALYQELKTVQAELNQQDAIVTEAEENYSALANFIAANKDKMPKGAYQGWIEMNGIAAAAVESAISAGESHGEIDRYQQAITRIIHEAGICHTKSLEDILDELGWNPFEFED